MRESLRPRRRRAMPSRRLGMVPGDGGVALLCGGKRWSGHSCLLSGGAGILACHPGGTDILVCCRIREWRDILVPPERLGVCSGGKNAATRRLETDKNVCPTKNRVRHDRAPRRVMTSPSPTYT